MQNRQISKIGLLWTLIFLSGSTFASGGGHYLEDGSSVRIDRLYEKGKGYFYGSTLEGAPLKYCVRQGDLTMLVTFQSLKPFQNSSPEALSENLVDCAQPDSLIESVLQSDQLTAVLYYLNKRYRLSIYQNG